MSSDVRSGDSGVDDTVAPRRRLALLIGLALSLIATAVAAGVVLAYRSTHEPPMTREQYLAAANAICAEYGKRLDRIPPPNDPAAPGAIYESIGLALPVLRAQAAEVVELVPPQELKLRVDHFFVLTTSVVRALGSRPPASRQARALPDGAVARRVRARP